LSVTERYGIPIIEDAACALGALWDNHPAGSFGLAGCFSFHPRKAVTTGEGGMVTTNDEAVIRSIRMHRNHGIDPDAGRIDFIAPGFNYRMTDFQGALGVSQMSRIESIISMRREKATFYNTLLDGTAVVKPFINPRAQSVYQSYVVLLPHTIAEKRDDIIIQMLEKGIETTIGTYNMPMTSYFRKRYNVKSGDFPVTEDIAARSLTLPLHGKLTGDEQRFIIRTLLEFCEAS